MDLFLTLFLCALCPIVLFFSPPPVLPLMGSFHIEIKKKMPKEDWSYNVAKKKKTILILIIPALSRVKD